MKKEPKAQTQTQNSPNCLYWFCQNKLHPQRPRPATHRTPWISCQCALARHHQVFPDVTCLCPGWSELFWQHSMRQVVLWWILVSNIAPYCLDGAFLQHPCNIKMWKSVQLEYIVFLFQQTFISNGTFFICRRGSCYWHHKSKTSTNVFHSHIFLFDSRDYSRILCFS